MNSNLYSSLIVHERFKPFKHKFKYFIPSFLIDYDDLTTISKKIRIFSYNKFNLYSFYEKDHGYRNGTSLISYVKDFVISDFRKRDFFIDVSGNYNSGVLGNLTIRDL